MRRHKTTRAERAREEEDWLGVTLAETIGTLKQGTYPATEESLFPFRARLLPCASDREIGALECQHLAARAFRIDGMSRAAKAG